MRTGKSVPTRRSSRRPRLRRGRGLPEALGLIDMSAIRKITDKVVEHAAEAAVAAVSVLLVWVAKQLSPVVVPLIESTLSNQVLVALLLASLAVNILLALIIYVVSRKPAFKLKCGIYWDREKNPHCPACQKPVAAYGEYQSGKGYYCKPCGKVFPLADARDRDIDPANVISQI